MSALHLTVNGRATAASATPRTHLADHLREALDLTGTHLGCEQGACGACTVLLDGTPVRGCLVRAVECEGADVRTIEGFDDDPVMAELRAAFTAHHALQCGYCTPGMLITGRDIVLRLGEQPEKRVREELAGNLCRCTGYQGIVGAIMAVSAGRAPQVPAPAVPVSWAAPTQPVATARLIAAPSLMVAAAPPAVRASPPVDAAAAPPAAGPGGPAVTESFTVAAPPDAVFAALADPHRVAACLPGAEITAWDGQRLEGRMRVALGPIKVAFAGAGEATADPAQRSGRLTGQGRDGGTGSGMAGSVEWRVAPQGAGSLVSLSLNWRLSGALAGFSRGGLVRDLVGRMARDFGANLSAMLTGGPPSPPPSLLRLLIATARGWIAARLKPRPGGTP